MPKNVLYILNSRADYSSAQTSINYVKGEVLKYSLRSLKTTGIVK